MTHDIAAQLLLTELQAIDQPTLWYADENVAHLVASLGPTPALTIITNRYDIYQSAQRQQLHCVFSDFNPAHYPADISTGISAGIDTGSTQKILYRVSKEKALTHFLLNQASQLLADSGSLVISGYKQEGIKSYGDKLKKQLNATGRLKKSGNGYLGHFQFSGRPSAYLDDQDYAGMQAIQTGVASVPQFYSKPGVFGWNKIDQGTRLLLEALQEIYPSLTPKPQTVLDIGCGYGWIFLNLAQYGFDHITATDNNAAALLCAQKNAALIETPVTITASDCANNLDQRYDLVLCNPPFHQGFQHNQQLTEQFVASCYRHTHKGGHCLMVVNEFIGLEKIASDHFKALSLLHKEQGFKVVLLEA